MLWLFIYLWLAEGVDYTQNEQKTKLLDNEELLLLSAAVKEIKYMHCHVKL